MLVSSVLDAGTTVRETVLLNHSYPPVPPFWSLSLVPVLVGPVILVTCWLTVVVLGLAGDTGLTAALTRRLNRFILPPAWRELPATAPSRSVPGVAVASVLDALAVRPGRVAMLKDVPLGNGNWLIELPGGRRAVLRRYHPGTSPEDLAYEHAVLAYLAAAGWVVPHPVSDPVSHDGLWYCLTRYVPGQPATRESPVQRRRRGRDLARLDLALRGLGQRTGQRPGWRPQHSAVTASTAIDWPACGRQLAAISPRLSSWAQAAAGRTRDALAAIGAAELPLTVIHGDFAEWNVHYRHGRLAGVIDFGLTRQDSRPYELAIARTWRAPEAADAYRAELTRSGWPLTALEETAIKPVYHAFRLDQAAWEIHCGLNTGQYNLTAIERHLSRTGTPPP